MPSFREVPDEDRDAFRSMVSYAFSPEDGPFDPEEADDPPPGATIGTRYGLYDDDDDLLTVCRHIDFRTRVRGDYHDLHGLSAVASPPEHRRRGHVAEMLRESLVQSRENGVYLSALWPFKRSFYAQYGWATCTRAVEHVLDPDALSFAPAYDDSEFVVLDADDWERVDPVHDAHGAGYELTMDRTEEWWRTRVFDGWRDTPFAYGFEREDGDLAAYVTYSVQDDDGKTLQVRDWAAVDHDARLAVLRFLADHDSQVDAVSVWTRYDADLLDLLPETEAVDAEVKLCPMARLVDVEDALEALSYPEGASCDLVLDVADPLAGWNDDAYRVRVADGTATVERSDAAPDVKLGVGALSQLAVGYHNATHLATLGEVDAQTDAVDALAACFPERPTFLREGF
jgi:predicted acetyltransferase